MGNYNHGHINTALWMAHLRESKQAEKGIFCPETALNIFTKCTLQTMKEKTG